MIIRPRRTRSGGGTPSSLRWSSLATWGGSFPAQGVPITIPNGFNLIMDVALVDSDAPGLITVQSGGSITVDSALDTRLVCDGVYINGGRYIAGTSGTAHPVKHWIDLCGAIPTVSGNVGGGALIRGPTHTGTLAGTSTGNNGTTNDNNGFSRGFIVDSGGLINLYGQSGPLARRLNAHYASGTTLVLDAAVTAKAGDTVLISPTGLYNASTRTETRILAADVNNSTTITVTVALGYARWGLLQYATDSGITTSSGQAWTLKTGGNPTGMRTSSSLTPDVDNVIDQRAFVCIMNRSIRIRGYDRTGGNTSLASEGFGFHGMTMDLNTETVIQNVEMVNYGQLGLLGRYGWHFHRNSYGAGVGAAAYATGGIAGTNGVSANFPTGKAHVEGCTGRQGFNRFFTFHACRGVEAIDNMAHDSAGHTFFEEDGSEEDNTSLRNIALAPRDPTSTYRLKGHDVEPSGHWIANFNNRHEGLWGVDTPFVGVWNSVGHGLYAVDNNSFASDSAILAWFNNPTTASGCLGASSNVPLWPAWSKFGTWKNNAGFVCGTFGVRTEGVPTSNEGSIVQSVSQPRTTLDGIPAIDANCLPLALQGIIAYKCLQGGYFNFVTQPAYTNARMSDNKNHGFAGSTSPSASKNSFPILVRESLNHESHILNGDVQNAVASYHGDLQHIGVMAWNYSGGTVGMLPGNLFKSADGILGRNSVLSGYDLYDNSHDELSIPSVGWALYNSSGFWHSPGPALMNDTTTYNTYNPIGPGSQFSETALAIREGGTISNRGGGRACVYDHSGMLSQGPTQAGVPGSHIVYNQTFFTTGLTVATLEENTESVTTTTPFFGIEPRGDDGAVGVGFHWGFATQFSRLNSSGVLIAGATNNFRLAVGGVDAATGLGAHFTSAPKDGIVYWHSPTVAKNSTFVAIVMRKVSYLINTLHGSATDAVNVVIDWDGTVPARVFATIGGLNGSNDYNADWALSTPPRAKEYSSVGSRATLLATTTAVWNFWQDTANDKLWIRFRPHNHVDSDYFDSVTIPETNTLTAVNAQCNLIVKPA